MTAAQAQLGAFYLFDETTRRLVCLNAQGVDRSAAKYIGQENNLNGLPGEVFTQQKWLFVENDSGPLPTLARRAQTDENEALAELYDLIAGRTGFDVTDTDEYMEGCVIGLDANLVHKLRQGDFSRQAYLDLHGMTADAAQSEVEQFLMNAVRDGLRCVLIVHGRGRNSPGQVPVLKDRLKLWLTRGKLARIMLAFATARPHDGGPGALYVLLRRARARKQPLEVFEGAKR